MPDEIWNETARHYDEPALAALVLWIAAVNVFNRVNIATRQVPGQIPRVSPSVHVEHEHTDHVVGATVLGPQPLARLAGEVCN